MNTLSREQLNVLIQEQPGLRVSIFLPTHRAGPDHQQNPIRLRNALREAADRLRTEGLRVPDIHKVLAPAHALLADSYFWRHCRQGLAIYVSAEVFRYYCLPITVEERVVVGRRFYLRPLLPLLAADGQFYLLALSQNAVRLFQGTRETLHELRLEHVPHSIAEALKDEEPVNKELQFRSAVPGSRRSGSLIFYRSGDVGEAARNRLLRYCRQVDRGLGELLKDGHRPLVLAGVDYLRSLFRDVCHYPQVMTEGISGNPDRLSVEELHARAWDLVQPYFRQQQTDAVAHYCRLAGSSQACTQVYEIVAAASQGRVEILFLVPGVERWGTFDRSAAQTHVHPACQPGDEDLLDLAAIETLVHGGTVYVVAPDQIPTAAPVAAVFRY